MTCSRFAVLVWICAVCDVFISWIRVCGPFSVAIFDGCASLVSKRSLVVAVLDVQKTEKETVKDSGAAGIRLGRVNKGKGDVGGACGVVCVSTPTGDSISRMYAQPSRKLTWRSCVRASRKCAEALTHWAGPWCVCVLCFLSPSTSPHVFCLQEYVNEDLAVMKKELDQWRDEYAKRNDVRARARVPRYCVTHVR